MEGWVILSMMVDTRGRPFEVGVVRSRRIKDFETFAVKAMGHASYTAFLEFPVYAVPPIALFLAPLAAVLALANLSL